MSRDKQIEEMAEIIGKHDCYDCDNCKCVLIKSKGIDCIDYALAEHLTAKGYRKASDVAEEIFAEIEEKIDFNLSMISKIAAAKGGRANGKTILWAKHDVYTEMKEDIADLKKKYIGKGTNVTTKTEEGE